MPEAPNVNSTECPDFDNLLKTNQKLTYDVTLKACQDAIVRSQNHCDTINNIAIQALQNAVETANMTGKQAVRHGDLAIDHQWNLEPSQGLAEAEVLSSGLRPIIMGVLAQMADNDGSKN